MRRHMTYVMATTTLAIAALVYAIAFRDAFALGVAGVLALIAIAESLLAGVAVGRSIPFTHRDPYAAPRVADDRRPRSAPASSEGWPWKPGT